MNDIKISIIVPIYNVEKYLDRCMDSLLNQTLKDIEIIMVDDGSPDNCPQMCDEYAKKDNRVKVVHKENGGLGYARNSGLDVATGEYVALLILTIMWIWGCMRNYIRQLKRTIMRLCFVVLKRNLVLIALSSVRNVIPILNMRAIK